MGVDIHTLVIDAETGEELIKDYTIINGWRNSDFFSNMQLNGYDREYEYLPVNCGIPEVAKGKVREYYDNNEDGIYGYYYATVEDMIKWGQQYQPWIKAGWVSKYDKWLWETKHIAPLKDNVIKELFIEDKDRELEFIEYTVKDMAYNLINYLINAVNEGKIKTSDYFVYFFDC